MKVSLINGLLMDLGWCDSRLFVSHWIGVSRSQCAVEVGEEAKESAEHHQAREYANDPKRMRSVDRRVPRLKRRPVISLEDAGQAQVKEHDEDACCR